MSGIVSIAHPLHPNWDINPEWTILGRTLAITLSVRLLLSYDKVQWAGKVVSKAFDSKSFVLDSLTIPAKYETAVLLPQVLNDQLNVNITWWRILWKFTLSVNVANDYSMGTKGSGCRHRVFVRRERLAITDCGQWQIVVLIGSRVSNGEKTTSVSCRCDYRCKMDCKLGSKV